MRVVSLVPSWTETLLWAGVDVVGRTRFCVHPAEKIKNIPVVGGTKDADWDKIKTLKPDLVLFDREENTEDMSRQCPVPWHATHIRHIRDMPAELDELARALRAPPLQKLARRWEHVLVAPSASSQVIPALIECPSGPLERIPSTVVYVIWAHPWMAASADTFIGSVCESLGWHLWRAEKKYPVFDPQDFKDTLFLCSSEPYPFLKRRDLLAQLPGAVALVDGEKLSWFGLRSLLYLESCRKGPTQIS